MFKTSVAVQIQTIPVQQPGTQTQHPSLWDGGIPKKTNLACIPEMSHLWSQETCTPPHEFSQSRSKRATYTFNSFEPSTATRVLLPTISVGNTRSSNIFSWTLVRVRLRGLFCLTRELRVGLRSIRRCAMKTTWRSENFFSSSRVSLSRVT